MKLVAGNDCYQFSFSHKEFSKMDQINQMVSRGYAFSHATECVIRKNGIWIADANANCSNADQFVKEKGRKIALTRALKPFSKDLRTKFWEAYFKRK